MIRAYKSRDRLEVRTLRCGRNNPGSNPGHGTFFIFLLVYTFSTQYDSYTHVLVIGYTKFYFGGGEAGGNGSALEFQL